MAWEGPPEEASSEWASEGCTGAGHGKVRGQGVPGGANNKCKGPEAEKRLTLRGRERIAVHPELGGRQGVSEMRLKREMRKALKT